MNGYKKLLKNQKLRFKILKLFSFLPDITMIKIQYFIKMGCKLNLKKPVRYTEKLQWYKLFYRDPLMTECADKAKVRDYISKKGLDDILCDLYGVFDDPKDIDFTKLPQKFVIKTTNGSGTNIMCKNKDEVNVLDIREQLSEWLKRDCYGLGREWAYKDIKPQIIIEEFLEEDRKDGFDGINDYKFLCFNGKAKYVVLDVDRFSGHKRNIYDLEWNNLNIKTDCTSIDMPIEKPNGLPKMIEIANELASDFPCVRVDLYWVNGRPYFGELTFYPWTGYIKFDPDEFDFKLGELFVLPDSNVHQI